MNWSDFLTPAITTVAVYASMQLLQRGTATPITPAVNGNTTLRLPKFYAILGYVCLGMVVLAIGGALYEGDPSIWWAVLFIFLLFGGLGGACVLWHWNHHVSFTRNQFTVTDYLGNPETLRWETLTDVTYKPGSGYVYLHRAERKPVKLSHHLVGLQSFLTMLEEQTEWRVRDLLLPS